MNVLRGAAVFAGLGLGLIALAPSAYAQSYWNGAPNAPPPAPAYTAPGPYGWGFGGWAPGYAVNNTAVAPKPYWNGAPQAIGPGW
jgi:hypothetical protein